MSLGERRTAILKLVAEGWMNYEIAELTNFSRTSIDREISLILIILDVPNRTAAVVRALRTGVLDLNSLELKSDENRGQNGQT